MKLFVDECLSPRLAQHLARRGYDATCARDVGRMGERDDTVRDRCIVEDRVIVTHDAGDFRRLVGEVELHPGLIILEENSLAGSKAQLDWALAHIDRHAARSAREWMVNRIVEVSADGRVLDECFPPV